MPPFFSPHPSRHLLAPLAATLVCLSLASPALAADDFDNPKDAARGASVTVLKAAKYCFPAIVEASGTIIAREETMVRPERQGLKVSEILAEPGDSVTAGQNLARLTLPEGGTLVVQTPVAGLVSASTAVIGANASPRGEALFSIIARSEFDLVGAGADATSEPDQGQQHRAGENRRRRRDRGQGPPRRLHRRAQRPARPGVRLPHHQPQTAGEFEWPRLITIGQSCGLSVPLTAVLYGAGGTVVQVVRRARVETKRVEVGLMSGGQVEIKEGLTEGDIVVARAGALLREGDPVRPVTAAAEGN